MWTCLTRVAYVRSVRLEICVLINTFEKLSVQLKWMLSPQHIFLIFQLTPTRKYTFTDGMLHSHYNNKCQLVSMTFNTCSRRISAPRCGCVPDACVCMWGGLTFLDNLRKFVVQGVQFSNTLYISMHVYMYACVRIHDPHALAQLSPVYLGVSTFLAAPSNAVNLKIRSCKQQFPWETQTHTLTHTYTRAQS